MPVSEDELDSRIHSSSLSQNNDYGYSTSLSKAEQRKNNKPIMEKRRRARINQCLNELKALILDATNKDPARHTKLEKADILEMTVNHLQSVQRQRFSAAVASDPTVVHKFKTGFNECATEVSRYITSLEGIDGGVKRRLIDHLSTCVIGIPQQPLSLPNLPVPFATGTPEIRLSNSEDVNNNDAVVAAGRFQVPGGLQLIPSRLPSGELALLLPSSATLSSLFPKSTSVDLSGQPPHISAFTPVSKDVNASPHPEEGVKHENSHSEVSSTSNDGTIFKSINTPTKSQSSLAASSSLLIPLTELNSDYKKETYGLPVEKAAANVFKPLTVYTDPAYELLSPSRRSPGNGKSPLDFSLKKESQQQQQASPLSVSNRFARKRPLEDLSCNIQLLPPPVKCAKGGGEFKQECDSVRSRSNLDGNVSDEASGGRDMWRPW